MVIICVTFAYNVHELIATEVAVVVHGSTSKIFGSIKTAMIDLFDEWYDVVNEAAAATATVAAAVRIQEGRSFQYWEFMKHEALGV